ncbi:cyanate lyase C-terminal domain-containing protein [Scleroderma yunnanense]
MQRSYTLLAESLSAKNLDLHRASSALYPPIPLYRRLLRAHRSLPQEMRLLGDEYVKAEFHRHHKITNPIHVMGFLTQWKMYLDELPQDPSAKNFRKLDPTVFEKMSAEQLDGERELYIVALVHPLHTRIKRSITDIRRVRFLSRSLKKMFGAATFPSNSHPYSELPPINVALFEAKARKGLTFNDVAKAIGRDEVWVAAAFYGQAKLAPMEIEALARVLDFSVANIQSPLGSHWWPNRGLGPMPPTDPVIYRLYEGVLVYGHAIKAVIHEKFGDGIMSMIDCKVNVTKKPDLKDHPQCKRTCS